MFPWRNTVNKLEPLEVWKRSHWIFTVYIQSLIISLLRFEMKILENRIDDAAIELQTATKLIIASAAAMEFAADLTREQYEEQIRPMMIPPHVKSDDFSGMMLWDHACLIGIFKKISPIFKNLPPSLQSEQAEFISAYMTLSASHKAICQKFVGDDSGSLRNINNLAVKTLNKFEHNRLQLISQNRKCEVSCPLNMGS
jgi:hypothetical protein